MNFDSASEKKCLWFRINKLPDLTLNKYSSLEENGVGGVLEKHIAFLRLLNRKGIISNVSFHLFYLYLKPENNIDDKPGNRMEILFMVRGMEETLENVIPMMKASPLADFYSFDTEFTVMTEAGKTKQVADLGHVLVNRGMAGLAFSSCSVLSKTETILAGSDATEDDYYMIREWEMNDDGRLYSMMKMMEAMDESCLYRVDLYPVERAESLRKTLSKPMSVLRSRQDTFGGQKRDYDGKDVLNRYEKILEDFESSPHFISNIMVFSNSVDDGATILDSAGSEALLKGKYSISTFHGRFDCMSFLYGDVAEYANIKSKMIMKPSKTGMIVCREDRANLNLNYLPTFFTLEEIGPFFRFPALYDGEIIQKSKETAPVEIDKEEALFLGKDENGYDVYFPLKMFPKHAFISGVPGSGKTNTMYHIVSSLWKQHNIPFLVLEPAKKEYRALLNDPAMKEVYLFSPNANMRFPLHINPFDMPKGCVISEHIQTLRGVFEGAFPLDNPMPFILDTGIEAVYRELGWSHDDIYTGDEVDREGKKRKFPTMSQLYKKLEELVEDMDYGAEVKGNLKSALNVRIGSLLQREMGDVFDVEESTFSPEEWLNKPVVIELESMGAGPANFLNLMLCALIREALKVDPVFKGSVRHVIFIEEAHNLIGPDAEEAPGQEADAKVSATAFIVKMLAEVRALKEGIVIADQLPTKMADEVLKNTGLKLGLRITSQDDRTLLGGTMSARGLQLEQMATFEPGQALIFYEGLVRPFKLRINEYGGEIKDKEQKDQFITPKNDVDLVDMLREREVFREVTDQSINAYARKVSKRKQMQEKTIEEFFDWMNLVSQKQAEYQEVVQYIQMTITAENANTEESAAWFDRELLLMNEYQDLVANQKPKREVLLAMELLANDIKFLNRLLWNRWKKVGISELYRNGVLVVMYENADTILNICHRYISFFGTGSDVNMDAYYTSILKIHKEFEEELSKINMEV